MKITQYMIPKENEEKRAQPPPFLSPRHTSPLRGTVMRFPCSCSAHVSDAAAAAKSPQSCPTLCDPIDGSPLGSSVPGILQARTLEWVAISFSNA